MNWQAFLKWNKYNCKLKHCYRTNLPWSMPSLDRFCQTLNKDCCFVHFIVRQLLYFLLLGLWVWAVTSAITTRFSCANIFGFDIPAVFIIIRVDLQQNTLTTVYLPYARTNYVKFNIWFQGPSLWNTIDDNVKLHVSFSISVFKNYWRTNILKDNWSYLLFFLTFFFFCTLLPISWILMNIFIPYTSCVCLLCVPTYL